MKLWFTQHDCHRNNINELEDVTASEIDSQDYGEHDIADDFQSSEVDSKGLKKAKITQAKTFQSDWGTQFTWLTYNQDTKLMTCSLCMKQKKEERYDERFK